MITTWTDEQGNVRYTVKGHREVFFVYEPGHGRGWYTMGARSFVRPHDTLAAALLFAVQSAEPKEG